MTHARFTHVHTMEPHHRRRVELLAEHPDIRALFGFDRSTIAVTFAVVTAQLVIAWALSAFAAPFWAHAATALLVGSVLSHWAGQAIHETSHQLAARTRLANRALAWFANLPMLFPIAETFHRYHLDHHRFLGVETKDTDLPHALEVRFIGRSPVRKAAWLLLYFFVYSARGLTFIKRPSWAEVGNTLVQLAFTALLAKGLGWAAVGYLAASTIIGHSFHPVAAHFIHEHYTFTARQETFSYYGPLNAVTFNVGYHVEHHDFMAIPGSRLPKLHALAKAHYRTLRSHTSWSWVLWHFVVSKTMGVHSRLVRTEADFARARRQPISQQPMPAWES